MMVFLNEFFAFMIKVLRGGGGGGGGTGEVIENPYAVSNYHYFITHINHLLRTITDSE